MRLVALVRPRDRPSAQRERIAGYVRAAVGGAHFEIEHALELAAENELPDWLRQELATALLDLEGILQNLNPRELPWTS